MKLFGGSNKRNKAEQTQELRTPQSEQVLENTGLLHAISESSGQAGGQAPVRRRKPDGTANARKQRNVNSASAERGQRGNEKGRRSGGKTAIGNGRRKVRVILGTSMLLIITLVIAYNVWVKPPEREQGGLSNPALADSETPSVPGVNSANEINSGPRRKNTYTFLIVGIDKEGVNTDTMMTGMLDVDKGEVNIVSIPRDTLVNNGDLSIKKVNGIYGTAYAKALSSGQSKADAKKSAVEALKEGVKDILGYTVDCYVAVDIEAFVKLVDVIGGVDFDVPQNMDYDDPVQDLHIHLQKGSQHLDGAKAIQLVRFRSYFNGDIQRIQVQQDFLKAIAKKLLQIGTITKIGELSEIFKEYVDTSLEARELAFFGQEFLKLSSEDIHFYRAPVTIIDVPLNGQEYVHVNVDEWLELLNEALNPFNEQIMYEHLNIMTYENGVYLSTTGVYEDSRFYYPNAG